MSRSMCVCVCVCARARLRVGPPSAKQVQMHVVRVLQTAILSEPNYIHGAALLQVHGIRVGIRCKMMRSRIAAPCVVCVYGGGRSGAGYA